MIDVPRARRAAIAAAGAGLVPEDSKGGFTVMFPHSLADIFSLD